MASDATMEGGEAMAGVHDVRVATFPCPLWPKGAAIFLPPLEAKERDTSMAAFALSDGVSGRYAMAKGKSRKLS